MIASLPCQYLFYTKIISYMLTEFYAKANTKCIYIIKDSAMIYPSNSLILILASPARNVAAVSPCMMGRSPVKVNLLCVWHCSEYHAYEKNRMVAMDDFYSTKR